MFNRKYIFKVSILHCYVSLPEGIVWLYLCYTYTKRHVSFFGGVAMQLLWKSQFFLGGAAP